MGHVRTGNMNHIRTNLVLVDELLTKHVTPFEQAPVHANIPSKRVHGADDGRHDPQSEHHIVRCGLQVGVRIYANTHNIKRAISRKTKALAKKWDKEQT